MSFRQLFTIRVIRQDRFPRIRWRPFLLPPVETCM